MRFLVVIVALALCATAFAEDPYYKKRGKRESEPRIYVPRRTYCGDPPTPPTLRPDLIREKRDAPIAQTVAVTPEVPKFNRDLVDIQDEDLNARDMRNEVATNVPTKAPKGTKGPKPTKGTKLPKPAKNTKLPLIQKNSKKPHIKPPVNQRPFVWVLVKKYLNPKKHFNPKFKRPLAVKGPKPTKGSRASKGTKASKAPKATKDPKTTNNQEINNGAVTKASKVIEEVKATTVKA